MKPSKSFSMRATGPLACFTRPEMKVERVSYEVITPSAARALFEAVLWKPAIFWRVHEVRVMAPIRWASFLRNEVSKRMNAQADELIVEEARTQRNTVALRDVDYRITASFEMTEKAGEGDTVRKFEEMFERRLGQGQQFHQPYLGCREFAAHLEPDPGTGTPIDAAVDRPLGVMFFDFDYAEAPLQPLFFQARLQRGVLHVPSLEEARAFTAQGAQP
jgi:CRISPR-associated protein Cas5d